MSKRPIKSIVAKLWRGRLYTYKGYGVLCTTFVIRHFPQAWSDQIRISVSLQPITGSICVRCGQFSWKTAYMGGRSLFDEARQLLVDNGLNKRRIYVKIEPA